MRTQDEPGFWEDTARIWRDRAQAAEAQVEAGTEPYVYTMEEMAEKVAQLASAERVIEELEFIVKHLSEKNTAEYRRHRAAFPKARR